MTRNSYHGAAVQKENHQKHCGSLKVNEIMQLRWQIFKEMCNWQKAHPGRTHREGNKKKHAWKQQNGVSDATRIDRKCIQSCKVNFCL